MNRRSFLKIGTALATAGAFVAATAPAIQHASAEAVRWAKRKLGIQVGLRPGSMIVVEISFSAVASDGLLKQNIILKGLRSDLPGVEVEAKMGLIGAGLPLQVGDVVVLEVDWQVHKNGLVSTHDMELRLSDVGSSVTRSVRNCSEFHITKKRMEPMHPLIDGRWV